MRGVELLGRTPDGRRATRGRDCGSRRDREMLVRIDVRADLRAAQTQARGRIAPVRRAARSGSCIGIVPRPANRCRMFAHDFGDVIVQPARKIERVRRFRPIAEHHRHGRKHLHRNAVAVAFFDAPLRIPDVVGDLAKDAVADHHPRAARLVVFQPNESAVAVFRVEVGPVARENVRVQIDLHRGRMCQ